MSLDLKVNKIEKFFKQKHSKYLTEILAMLFNYKKSQKPFLKSPAYRMQNSLRAALLFETSNTFLAENEKCANV